LLGKKTGGTEKDAELIDEYIINDSTKIIDIYNNLGEYKNLYTAEKNIIMQNFRDLYSKIKSTFLNINNLNDIKNLDDINRNDTFSKIFYFMGFVKNKAIGSTYYIGLIVPVLESNIKKLLTKIYFETTLKYFKKIHYLRFNDEIDGHEHIKTIYIENICNNIIKLNFLDIDYSLFNNNIPIFEYNKNNINEFINKLKSLNIEQQYKRWLNLIINYLNTSKQCIYFDINIENNTLDNILKSAKYLQTKLGRDVPYNHKTFFELYKKSLVIINFTDININDTVRIFYDSPDLLNNFNNFYDNICENFTIGNGVNGISNIVNYINNCYDNYKDKDNNINLTYLDKFKIIKSRKNTIYKYYNQNNEIKPKYISNADPDGVGINLDDANVEGSIGKFIEKIKVKHNGVPVQTNNNYWMIFTLLLEGLAEYDNTSPIEVYPRIKEQKYCKVDYTATEPTKKTTPDTKDFMNIQGIIQGEKKNIAITHKRFCKQFGFIYDKNEYEKDELNDKIKLGPDVIYYNNGIWMASITNDGVIKLSQ
jgi:hypothetical protein